MIVWRYLIHVAGIPFAPQVCARCGRVLSVDTPYPEGTRVGQRDDGSLAMTYLVGDREWDDDERACA